MKRFIGLMFVFGLLLSGCATVFKGPTRSVDLSSEPAGANVFVDGNDMGDTPITLNLVSNRFHTITVKKSGYPTKTYEITNRVGGLWIVLDILCGLVPVIV